MPVATRFILSFTHRFACCFMAASVLAALRIYGRSHKLSYKNSKPFRDTVNAAMALQTPLRSSVRNDDCELDARVLQFKRSAMLQRQLEVDHKMPHRRSLVAATQEAIAAGVLDPSASKIALDGNLSRHRKWMIPAAPSTTTTAVASSDCSPIVLQLMDFLLWPHCPSDGEAPGSTNRPRSHAQPQFVCLDGDELDDYELDMVNESFAVASVSTPRFDPDLHLPTVCSCLVNTDTDTINGMYQRAKVLREPCCLDDNERVRVPPPTPLRCAPSTVDGGSVEVRSLQHEIDDGAEPEDFVEEFARISGVVSKPEINGRTVIVQAYHASKHRFGVLIIGAEKPMLVRPCSLLSCYNPRWFRCGVCHSGDPYDIAMRCRYCDAHPDERVAALRRQHPTCEFLTHYDEFVRHKIRHPNDLLSWS